MDKHVRMGGKVRTTSADSSNALFLRCLEIALEFNLDLNFRLSKLFWLNKLCYYTFEGEMTKAVAANKALGQFINGYNNNKEEIK